MRRCGFTLIELLVVIAIIAILAAILFPVFAQAKRAAKDAAAINNVKQTSTAHTMYTGDYDDTVVIWEQGSSPWVAWPVLIQPYMKNTDLLFDPARQRTVTIPSQPWNVDPNNRWAWQTHLAINKNAFASRPENSKSVSMTGLEHLNERIAFAYQEVKWSELAFSQHWFDAERSSCPVPGVTADSFVTGLYNPVWDASVRFHGEGLIATFADTHARKIPNRRYMKTNSSYADANTCQQTNFHGPDGAWSTGDDPDTAQTQFWGRWWEPSY